MLTEEQVKPIHPDDEGFAGRYLQDYEWERYTLAERLFSVVNTPHRIIVSPDAEQFADLSFWQKGTDWDIYAQNAKAVILRISQGNWKDSEFETFYAAARERGLIIGGYHFYDDRYSPEEQAATIIAAMAGKHFEKELYIDWEVVYGGKYQGLANVVKLMKLLEAAGLKVYGVGVYTGYYFFIEHSSLAVNAPEYLYLSSRPLWLAWYAAASIVKVPYPWTESTWIDWQWGTPSWSWGQPTNEIDMNRSRYVTTEFTNKYAGGTEPPPGGGMEITHIGTVLVDLNVRSGPGTSYPQSLPPLGILRKNDVVDGQWDEAGTQWFHFEKITRADGTVEMFTAWASAVNGMSANPPYIRVEAVTTPPPSGPAQIEIVYDPAAVEITLTPQP